MIVSCEQCGRSYDDVHRWTICPHNILEAAPDAPRYNCGNPGYCAAHDLFGCPAVAFPRYGELREDLLQERLAYDAKHGLSNLRKESKPPR